MTLTDSIGILVPEQRAVFIRLPEGVTSKWYCMIHGYISFCGTQGPATAWVWPSDASWEGLTWSLSNFWIVVLNIFDSNIPNKLIEYMSSKVEATKCIECEFDLGLAMLQGQRVLEVFWLEWRRATIGCHRSQRLEWFPAYNFA